VFVAALLFLSPIRVLLCHWFADYSQCPHYNSPLVFVFSSVAVIVQTKRESGRRVSQRGGSPGLPTSTSALEKSLVLTHSSAAMQKPTTSTVVRPHWATASQPPSVRIRPPTASASVEPQPRCASAILGKAQQAKIKCKNQNGRRKAVICAEQLIAQLRSGRQCASHANAARTDTKVS